MASNGTTNRRSEKGLLITDESVYQEYWRFAQPGKWRPKLSIYLE